MDREKAEIAASVLAASGNGNEAARQAGVNRSTVTRWMANPEFRALIATYEEAPAPKDDDVSGQATKSLGDLVSESVSVIERALAGEKSLVSSARLGLDVIKTAAQLAPKGQSGNEAPPLADLIKQLDEREKASKRPGK